MIKVENLRFEYRSGEFTLRVGELAIERAATAAVIGPSGSGKTTLLHLIAGITLPQAGRVTVKDAEMTGLSDAARRDFRIRHIGLVFQEFELLDYLRVVDNILLPYRIHPSLRIDKAVRRRAGELAEMAGIGDKLHRSADQLSHGERQRVAVCRSLLPRPPVVLADEPTGNLDPANKRRIYEILFDYARDNGATMLAVTHDHEQLDKFSRVVDMRNFDGDGER